jgi:hypothetical protein
MFSKGVQRPSSFPVTRGLPLIATMHTHIGVPACAHTHAHTHTYTHAHTRTHTHTYRTCEVDLGSVLESTYPARKIDETFIV